MPLADVLRGMTLEHAIELTENDLRKRMDNGDRIPHKRVSLLRYLYDQRRANCSHGVIDFSAEY